MEDQIGGESWGGHRVEPSPAVREGPVPVGEVFCRASSVRPKLKGMGHESPRKAAMMKRVLLLSATGETAHRIAREVAEDEGGMDIRAVYRTTTGRFFVGRERRTISISLATCADARNECIRCGMSEFALADHFDDFGEEEE